MADFDVAAALAQAAKNGSAGAYSAGQPQVFWGHNQSTSPHTGHGGDDLVAGIGRTPGDTTAPGGDLFKSIDEAYLLPYESEATRQGLGQQMYEAGLIEDPHDYAAINKMWQIAVDEAANFHQAGRKITPWQVLDIMGGKTGVQRQAGPQKRTTTQTSTSIPNEADLQRVVEQIYKENVGRAPNESELARYTAMLTNKARKNPTKTTTTTQYDASGNATTSSSVTQQGLDASSLAYEAQKQLEDTSEFGVQQAALYYMNALGAALGAPAG